MLSRVTSTFIALLCMTSMLAAETGDTRLVNAVMKGDTATVQALLKERIDVNVAQGDGMTALHWAAYRDDVELAKTLIQAGAVVSARTRLGEMTPLFMAAKNGNAAMIEVLINAGAVVNAKSTTGTTALMLAAGSGKPDAVKILIDRGADINAKDVNQGQTALIFAAAMGRTEVVKLLAARGADLNLTSLVPDPVQKKPKQAEAPKADEPKPANAQQQRPAENATPSSRRAAGPLALGGMTAVQFAAREGYLDTVKTLVEAGSDINVLTASDKMSTLTIAIMNARFDVAKYLIEKGADAKPANSTGLTALWMLIDAQWPAKVWYPAPSSEEEKTSYLEVMKMMLDRGADPNARLGQKLWQRQFHPDWVDPAGATAFWRAAQANDVAAMKMLLAYGANPSITNNTGQGPLHVAAGWGFEPQISTFIPDERINAVKFLVEEVGLDINQRDDKGYTPLHGSALMANNDLIRYMVAMGADVKARANSAFGPGDTAISIAVAAGMGDTVADMANGPRSHNLVHPETLELLVSMGSINSDNCRASTCVIKERSDKKPNKN